MKTITKIQREDIEKKIQAVQPDTGFKHPLPEYLLSEHNAIGTGYYVADGAMKMMVAFGRPPSDVLCIHVFWLN